MSPKRETFRALVFGAAVGLTVGRAAAGPCAKDIADFEKVVRAAPPAPDAGPGGPQSIAAQQQHQPTPQSVNEAKAKAQKGFEAVLARAKQLDADGKAECAGALTDAKLIWFQ